VRQLNTQHIFHPLTQNTIILLNLVRKPCLICRKRYTPWFTKFVFEKFFSLFYIISIPKEAIYIKNWILIAVLRKIVTLFLRPYGNQAKKRSIRPFQMKTQKCCHSESIQYTAMIFCDIV
jgi:hypothetical protein